MECDNDRRLQAFGEERLEAQLAHSLPEHPTVLAIAPRAAGLSALGPELLKRLVEGDDDLDGWRKAVLAGSSQVLPLVAEIERQGRGIALSLGQRRLAAENESKTRHPLDALVGGRGQCIEPSSRCIQRQRSKRAHGIDQQLAPVALHYGANLGDGLPNTAVCFAVHRKQ